MIKRILHYIFCNPSYYFRFSEDKIWLQCERCGYETKGWDIDDKRTYPGRGALVHLND